MNGLPVTWPLAAFLILPLGAAFFSEIGASSRPEKKRTTKMNASNQSIEPTLPRAGVLHRNDSDRKEAAEEWGERIEAASTQSQPSRTLLPDVIDEEIAQFDRNRLLFDALDSRLRDEVALQLLDDQAAHSLAADQRRLLPALGLGARSHALCTASVCEVQWASDEPLETLVPKLVPWLLERGDFAVGDGREVAASAQSDTPEADFTRGLRILFPRA